MSNYVDFQRQRDFGGVISATFDFIKANFKPLLRLLFTYSGPIILIAAILLASWQSDFLNIGTSDYMTAGGTWGLVAKMLSWKYWVAILIQGISSLVLMGTVYGYVVAYVEKKGENVEIEEAWDRAKSMFINYFGTMILSLLIVLGSCIFLFIPAIYFGVVLSLIFVVQMAERTGFGSAFSRCFQLIKGNWWQTFGLIIVMYMMVGMIAMVFTVPMQIYRTIIGFSSLGGGGYSANTFIFIVLGTLSQFLSSILGVVPMIALAVQYYSLIEQKESPSLINQINLIGNDTVSFPSQATVYSKEENEDIYKPTYQKEPENEDLYKPKYEEEVKKEEEKSEEVKEEVKTNDDLYKLVYQSDTKKEEEIKKNTDDDLPKFTGL